MAAPTFNTANTGATDAGGVWSFGWGSLQGGPIIVQILQDGSTDGAVTFTGNNGINNLAGSAGWTAIAGPNGDGSWPVGASGEARQFLFIGRGTGAASPTISGGNSTSEDLYCRMYAFNNVSTGTTLATVIENSTAGNATNGAGTAASVTDTAVTTLGPDRLALNFIGINDDNAISAFTGETGGDWTEAVAEYAESSGTDASIGLQICSTNFSVLQETDGTLAYNLGANAATTYIAQSFSIAGAGTLHNPELRLGANIGSPSDDLILEIRTDSAGSPSSTVVASATVTSANLTAGAWNTFPLTASLSAATLYWLTVHRSGAVNGSHYRTWENANADAYAGGSAKNSSDGSSWSALGSGDTMFRAWVDSVALTIDGGSFTQADGTDGWGVVGFALIGTTVVLDQQHYRFRNDDGNETTATWLADLDTDVN